MSISPYKLYYKNRPIKIAFILSKETSLLWINSIIEYNMTIWWWRFNKIFLLKKVWRNYLIDKNSLLNLQNFDPDIICTDIDFSETLKTLIFQNIAPLSIEKLEKNTKWEFILNHNIGAIKILPNESYILDIAHYFEQPYFVNFKPKNHYESDKSMLELFIGSNFGWYNTEYSNYSSITLMRNYKEYLASSKEDIVNFIEWYSTLRHSVVFPSQISTLPIQFANKEYDYLDDDFLIVVWDTIQDMIFAWNRQAYMGDWRYQYINQLWIPKEIFSEISNIKDFFDKIWSTYWGWQQQRNVVIVSASLNANELKSCVWELSSQFSLIYRYWDISDYSKYKFSNYFSIDYTIWWLKSIDLVQDNSRISLEKPNIFPHPHNGKYMTDIYIEYHPEKLLNFIGKDHWWQFPRNNNILRNSFIKTKKSRVKSNRHASVLMDSSENKEILSRNKNDIENYCSLELNIPNDFDYFRSVILSNKSFNRDYKLLFHDLATSDAGKTLRWITGVFESLYSLYSVFEDNFWRKLFTDLAKSYKSQKNQLSENIKKGIKKDLSLPDFNDLKSEWYEEFINSVVTIIWAQTTGLHLKQNITTSLNEILDEAKKLQKEWDQSISIEYIERQILDFIEKKILIQWVKAKCHKCSHSNWYSLSELDSHINCKTCSYLFILDPKVKWSLKLNDLIVEVIENTGLVPVILVLGELFFNAHTSFIYSNPLDIYKTEKKKVTDLDICCIVDWEFIIWEIKEKHDAFREKQFKAFLSIWLKLKPDRIIFSSLDSTASSKKMDLIKNTWIKELQDEFDKRWILTIVTWYNIGRTRF